MEEEVPGEGIALFTQDVEPTPQFYVEQIVENKLCFEEASRCLTTLGKDESAVRFAYLMLSAIDKKLTDVSVIVNFSHLQFVDVSGNYLTTEALQVLTQLPFLIYIRASNNKVESACFSTMHYLQVLILNKNFVRETGDISQPILETLELADNYIYTVQFDPDRLENLKELVLSSNHLLDTTGIYPKNLERLFMGKNKISRINTDLTLLKYLKYLHLRDNNIRKLSGFTEVLENLSYLNLRGNKINKLRQLRKLKCLPKLETLIVLDNPFYRKDRVGSEYRGEITATLTDLTVRTEMDEATARPQVDTIRVRILAILPNLIRLNKDFVSLEETEVVESTRQSLLDEIYGEESSEDDTDIASTTDYTTDFTDTDVEIADTRKYGTEEGTDVKLESKTVEFLGVKD
ncbi:leucine-rich repeat-containing protein 23-like [Diabrotica virgifera virgifera]|uniref:Leucine-rich repeat-containing protein 23-like n=1 Tax=Diabrotica virgifera virgifera TaxID=50390 RepID=A0ABM5IT04_DIAVI|nr:leucine-rich repeat-containing protein 23-like [Diabrotica virgifera virgifera]